MWNILQRTGLAAALVLAGSATAPAQTTIAPATPAQVPGTQAPGTQAPGAPVTPVNPGGSTPSVPPAPLAPTPGEATPSQPDAPVSASVGEPVTLEAQPALVLEGQSSWDDGFSTLVTLFQTLSEEAAAAKLTPAARPRVYFTETDDNGFKCQAILPLGAAPPADSKFGRNVVAGMTPAGKALRFPHTGPYDDIDSVYEAISAYLDDKGLTAKGTFIEEYVTDLKDSADPALEMNIFVLLQ